MAFGDVTLRFEMGHPTRLSGFRRLALLVALLGPPARIRRGLGSYRATWAETDSRGVPLGASIPDAWRDGRALVRIDVEPDAYRAAAAFAMAAADAASAALSEAEAAAEAARVRYATAERAAINAEMRALDAQRGEVG